LNRRSIACGDASSKFHDPTARLTGSSSVSLPLQPFCSSVIGAVIAPKLRAFRRSELVALDVADIEEMTEGLRVTIRKALAAFALPLGL
jgi:hypothetical protein